MQLLDSILFAHASLELIEMLSEFVPFSVLQKSARCVVSSELIKGKGWKSCFRKLFSASRVLIYYRVGPCYKSALCLFIGKSLMNMEQLDDA